MLKNNEKPSRLRRITCKSPEGKEYILNTTILDKKIGKDEKMLYLTH